METPQPRCALLKRFTTIGSYPNVEQGRRKRNRAKTFAEGLASRLAGSQPGSIVPGPAPLPVFMSLGLMKSVIPSCLSGLVDPPGENKAGSEGGNEIPSNAELVGIERGGGPGKKGHWLVGRVVGSSLGKRLGANIIQTSSVEAG